jgi:hypothetical protein
MNNLALLLLAFSAHAQNRTVELPAAKLSAPAAQAGWASPSPRPAFSASAALQLPKAPSLPAAASFSAAASARPEAAAPGASAALSAQASFGPKAAAAKTGEGASAVSAPVFDGAGKAARAPDPVAGRDGSFSALKGGPRKRTPAPGGRGSTLAVLPAVLLPLAAAAPDMTLGGALFLGVVGGLAGTMAGIILAALLDAVDRDLPDWTFHASVWGSAALGFIAAALSAYRGPDAFNSTMLWIFGSVYGLLAVILLIRLGQRLFRRKK